MSGCGPEEKMLLHSSFHAFSSERSVVASCISFDIFHDLPTKHPAIGGIIHGNPMVGEIRPGRAAVFYKDSGWCHLYDSCGLVHTHWDSNDHDHFMLVSVF